MSTNRARRLVAEGDWLNASGASQRGQQSKLKLGSTVLIDTAPWSRGPKNSSASRSLWRVEALIMNLGATNAQSVYFGLRMGIQPCTGTGTITAGITTGEGVQFSSF